jgi:amidase
VLYCKTNVPTAMMMGETVNNLHGRTVNPRHRRCTPGGSSGGEAALVLARGAPLGVGTDIGGSLRIPAACAGLFTLRPSFGRLPTLGGRSGMPGQEAVQSVNGPLARTLADLGLYCRAVVGLEPWREDPRCLPMPWREVEGARARRVGVMWDDGVVLPTPPVRRALASVVERLRRAGWEVVEWDNKDQAKGLELLERMFVADGAKAIKHELQRSGEPLRPEMAAFDNQTELGTYDMWQLHSERVDFQKKYLDRWNEAGIEALLCPTTPFSFVGNGRFKHGKALPNLAAAP